MVKPLEGIRVLDLTRLLPGSVATMLLADLGADVVKIEDPFGGDYARWMEPQIRGSSVFFNVNNRGKRSIILNLKHQQGPETLRRLVESADILIESFRPGTMAKLGCDYDSLRVVNQRLIYCGLSGWGTSGPLAHSAGHDLNYVAHGGLTAAMETPQPMGGQVADMGGAYIAVAGILAALFRRERTGEGGFIDTSLAESALPFNIYNWTEAAAGGSCAGQGHLTGGLAYYRVYTALDGVAVALAALEEKFWRNFCTAVARPDLIELHGRVEAQPELQAELARLFASRTASEWDAVLTPADCCFSVVPNTSTTHESPQFQSRGMMGVDEDGQPFMRSPIRIDDDLAEIGAVPGYGEHTRSVLLEYGFSAEEISNLIELSCVKVR